MAQKPIDPEKPKSRSFSLSGEEFQKKLIESPTEALAALGIELRGEEATKLSNEVKTLTAAADLIAGSISLNERIELKAGGTGLRIQEQRDRKSGDI